MEADHDQIHADFSKKSDLLTEDIKVGLADFTGSYYQESKKYFSLKSKISELAAEYKKIITISKIDDAELLTHKKDADLERELRTFREKTIGQISDAMDELREEYFKFADHRNSFWAKWLLILTTLFTGASLLIDIFGSQKIITNPENPINVEVRRAKD